ncbi:MAG: hypothetical protein HYX74_12245 [Acidobacteria bacterium]|nr:hypothetical protein [Acidobacteriota bacterium]
MDIAQRLHLDGTFSIESVQFTSFSVQEKLAELSWRARGRPKEEKENYPRVASGMKGKFALKEGVGTISTLSFRVPGASVLLDGTFDLITEELDFRGELRMQARLSQTTSGFTSILLKVLDPFFKKKGAGSVLPIKITGTLNEPSFGLDF